MQNKQREVKEFDSHIIRRRFVGCLPLILIFLSSTAIMSGSNRGNIRVVVDDNGRLMQATDYLAFGLPVTSLSTALVDNRLLEGNEFRNFRGLGWTDNTARRLDNILCRFTAIDPLAEKYPDISPYASRANSPFRLVDPDGKQIFFASPPPISTLGWTDAIISSKPIVENLGRVSENAKPNIPNSSENHHIIPKSLGRNFDAVKDARRSVFKIDGKNNKIPLE